MQSCLACCAFQSRCLYPEIGLSLESASVAVGVVFLCCFHVNNDVQVAEEVASGVHVHVHAGLALLRRASIIPIMCTLRLRVSQACDGVPHDA